MTNKREFRAAATISGKRFEDRAIRDAELERARHALPYLKRKLGNDAMRRLLDNDLRTMAAQVRSWVEASDGEWQSASVRLAVPGPSAQAFQDWYVSAMEHGLEAELRAGHPEHFVSHPTPDLVEVVENIGETELPWRIFHRALPEDFAFPMAWDPAHALHHGMEVVDADGLRVGFSIRLPGDSVTVAPGEKHWHGAAPGQLFIHLSIQAADEHGEQAAWLQHVTDEEYANEPNQS